MKMPTASGLERAEMCPGAYALPHVHSRSTYAEAGDARHRYLELVQGGKSKEDALAEIPEEHRSLCEAIDVDSLPKGVAAEVAFVYNVATDMAGEIGRGVKRDYGELGKSEIAGTGDAVGVSDDAVYVGDYKGPWAPVTPAKSNRQVGFLALAASRAYGKDRALVELIRIREDGSTYRDMAELDAFALDVLAQDMTRIIERVQEVQQAGGIPDVTEGEHCRYCPAWSSCPAKATLIQRLATGAEVDELVMLKPMTPETAGYALTRVKAAKKMLKVIEEAIYATREEYGYLVLPNGKEQRPVQEPGNKSIDGRTAYVVARDLYGQEFAEDAIEVKATEAGLKRAIDTLIAKGEVKPRGKGKALKAILAEVEERGGIKRPTVTKWVEQDPALPAAEQKAS